MNTILFIAGVLAGAGLLFFILYAKAPSMMILENESKYSLAETEEKLVQKATDMGWRIPTIHDLQQTMDKNGFEVLPVKVLEMCKPVYAHEILSRDQEKVVSSLMPCRIAIYQKSDGKVFISRMNSGLMAKPMKGVIPAIMKKATDDVELIISDLKK